MNELCCFGHAVLSNGYVQWIIHQDLRYVYWQPFCVCLQDSICMSTPLHTHACIHRALMCRMRLLLLEPCDGRAASADNLWAPPTFVDRRAADNLSARRRCHCCCVGYLFCFNFRWLKRAIRKCWG